MTVEGGAVPIAELGAVTVTVRTWVEILGKPTAVAVVAPMGSSRLVKSDGRVRAGERLPCEHTGAGKSRTKMRTLIFQQCAVRLNNKLYTA